MTSSRGLPFISVSSNESSAVATERPQNIKYGATLETEKSQKGVCLSSTNPETLRLRPQLTGAKIGHLRRDNASDRICANANAHANASPNCGKRFSREAGHNCPTQLVKESTEKAEDEDQS